MACSGNCTWEYFAGKWSILTVDCSGSANCHCVTIFQIEGPLTVLDGTAEDPISISHEVMFERSQFFLSPAGAAALADYEATCPGITAAVQAAASAVVAMGSDPDEPSSNGTTRLFPCAEPKDPPINLP